MMNLDPKELERAVKEARQILDAAVPSDWTDLHEERIRLEEALGASPGVEVTGGGGDLDGMQADISYRVVKDGTEHEYAIILERLS